MKNLIGKKVGTLTVVEYFGKKGNDAHSFWVCRCECGKTVVAASNKLLDGGKRNAQCECTRRNIKHGDKRESGQHPLYSRWCAMKARCNNPKNKRYARYGGRGIKVCERWSNYENFKEDMGPTFQEHLLLERKDNDGPYCLENCIWATQEVQSNNQSTTRFITFEGLTLSLSQWARKIGKSPGLLYQRLSWGWPLERALSSNHFHRSGKATV